VIVGLEPDADVLCHWLSQLTSGSW
jgi:hypothetical protein